MLMNLKEDKMHDFLGKHKLPKLILMKTTREICKIVPSQALVVHGCNPSYSGGRDQKDRGLRPAWENSLRDPISKTPSTKKGYSICLAVQPKGGGERLCQRATPKAIRKTYEQMCVHVQPQHGIHSSPGTWTQRIPSIVEYHVTVNRMKL
jgi:hypothetical protein